MRNITLFVLFAVCLVVPRQAGAAAGPLFFCSTGVAFEVAQKTSGFDSVGAMKKERNRPAAKAGTTNPPVSGNEAVRGPEPKEEDLIVSQRRGGPGGYGGGHHHRYRNDHWRDKPEYRRDRYYDSTPEYKKRWEREKWRKERSELRREYYEKCGASGSCNSGGNTNNYYYGDATNNYYGPGAYEERRYFEPGAWEYFNPDE